jgi:TonB family protein
MGSNLYSALRASCSVARMAGVLALCPASLLAQGAITGRVLDSLGTALSGAQITLDSSSSRAVTDASGAFRLSSVPAGTLEVRFRRLGYHPDSRTVRVESGMEARVDVRLAPLPLRLQTVEVRRRAEAYDSRLAGFNARRDRKVGHFVTREDLDRMSSARFVDALRNVPGVQMRPLRGGGTTLALRGSRCPPLVFIDGFPTDAGVMDLDMIDLAGVEGVEIYSGVATVPPEFMGARGTHGCGVVAIWSRPARARKQRVSREGQVDLEKLLASRAVYTSDQVDEPAHLRGPSAAPTYPDSLWRAGVPGRVVAEFIVDSEGVIEPGSLRIASSTHPYFTSAVKAALDNAEFRPAQLGGKSVRQIVQLPFVFSAEARDSIPPPAK